MRKKKGYFQLNKEALLALCVTFQKDSLILSSNHVDKVCTDDITFGGTYFQWFDKVVIIINDHAHRTNQTESFSLCGKINQRHCKESSHNETHQQK